MKSWLIIGGVCVAALAAGAAVAVYPPLLAGLLAVMAFVVVAARAPERTTSVLVVAAVPFMRPFILGERYTPVGIALVAAAVLLAVVSGARERRSDPAVKAAVVWLAALWLWMLCLPIIHPGADLVATLKGAVGVWFVASAACVLACPTPTRAAHTCQ